MPKKNLNGAPPQDQQALLALILKHLEKLPKRLGAIDPSDSGLHDPFVQPDPNKGGGRTRRARALDLKEPHPLGLFWVTAQTRQGQAVPVTRTATAWIVSGVALDQDALIAADGTVRAEVVVPLDGVQTRVAVQGWIAMPVPMTIEDLER